MRRKIILTFACALFIIYVNAQNAIPNAGFENWTNFGGYSDPDDWGTINSLTSIIGAVTVSRGTDVHGGAYSIRLESKYILLLGQTAPGIAATGTINTSGSVTGGVAFNKRPVSFTGWYKYQPNNPDTALIEARLYKWNTTTQQRDLVGEAVFNQRNTISSYTQFNIPFAYQSADIPDTLVIILLTSSMGDQSPNGSILFVDDLAFDYNCPSLNVSTTATDESAVGANDGTVDATATGGSTPYTFSWDNGSTTEDLAGVPAGNYCVTVTDVNGCTASACDTVEGPDCSGFSVSTVATDESAPGANDGAVDATINGGTGPFSYSWSTGDTTEDISGLLSGNYCITATAANGCTVSSCAIVSNPGCSGFSISISGTDPTVVGGNDGTATVTPNGGTPPYAFSGDIPPTTGLTAGTYCVTVTDNGGCVDTGCITLSDPDCSGFSVEAVGTDASSGTATDGSVAAIPTGGTPPFFYTWDNFALDSSVSNLAPGVYCVTVSDNSGCVDSACVTIGPDCSNLSLGVITTPDTSGNNVGTATADASGGTTPYAYSWNTGGTTQTITNLPSGVVCVTVTDGNGCTIEACDTVDMVDGLANLIEAGINLFPNPVQDVITVELRNPEAFLFRLFDVKGKLVMEEVLSSKSNPVSFRELSGGNYFVQLQQAATGKVFAGKLMKQ